MIRPRRGFTRIIKNITFKSLRDWITLARSLKKIKFKLYDALRPKELKAIIEGLYGNKLKLKLYDTVLLFITGIGIIAQFLYVRQLL